VIEVPKLFPMPIEARFARPKADATEKSMFSIPAAQACEPAP
jgi:hypothetical protein